MPSDIDLPSISAEKAHGNSRIVDVAEWSSSFPTHDNDDSPCYVPFPYYQDSPQ